MSTAPNWYEEIVTSPQAGNDKDRVLASLEKYEPAHELWANPQFQQWASTVTRTIESIEEHANSSWSFEKISQEHLKLLGLSVPRNQEEELRLYFALRAVVNFWRRKLDLLKNQSDKYEKAKEELTNELGR